MTSVRTRIINTRGALYVSGMLTDVVAIALFVQPIWPRIRGSA